MQKDHSQNEQPVRNYKELAREFVGFKMIQIRLSKMIGSENNKQDISDYGEEPQKQSK